MSIDISPRVLRYFIAVAEELHFGRAAARLYISQPSLSHQIGRLEDALGTPLFVRANRRVQLTVAGRTLLQEAPVALAALEQAVQRTRESGSGVATTTIRLGYTPVTGFDTLTVLLKALQEDYPQYVIELREVFSADIPDRLCAGDLDIGLALSPRLLNGVDGRLLRKEHVSALLSANHPLATGTEIFLTQLRHETLLLFPRPLAPAYYDAIVAACHEAGFSPDVHAFAEPPVNAMIARLSSGREIGLAPASFAEHAADASGDVVVRGVVGPPILAELSVLWPADDLSPTIANVLATTRRCSERHGWLRTIA